MKYLVDTNVLSEPLRPTPDAGVLERLQEHSSLLATASVVWNELWFGVECLPTSKRRTAIETYLLETVAPSIPVLPYDAAAARWHAAERARLRAAGSPKPFADGQIAAVARIHDLIVVTRNISDFKAFEGLRVEAWFS